MNRLVSLLFVLPAGVLAQEPPVAEGLAAWSRIYEVASHPRCTNCHVGDSGRPAWAALGYDPKWLHGMNVQAGDSRIGAETVLCQTCHITAASDNATPHAAPQIDDAWRLPPVALDWRDKTSGEICIQMRNPETNNGFEGQELAAHVRESAFVNWGFEPGGNRVPAPGTAEELARDIEVWIAAGTPCTADP
ncbi:hypothetical protein [uncultured Sulfitobacter sp.]|uniref:hypothetical protein n=1 Tax=uncultured Sulfitobacter sp. TaxID=191468 RepID=UPI00261340B1|nr:hypothetical protein [uncultured Sulfitobacter sp.]